MVVVDQIDRFEPPQIDGFFLLMPNFSFKFDCPTVKALNQHRFDLLGYTLYKAMKI